MPFQWATIESIHLWKSLAQCGLSVLMRRASGVTRSRPSHFGKLKQWVLGATHFSLSVICQWLVGQSEHVGNSLEDHFPFHDV